MDSPLPFDKPAPERPVGVFQSYFNLSLAFLPPGADTTPNNANQPSHKAQNNLKPLKLYGNKKAITSFKEGLSFFDKKNRCKVLFQATSKPDIGKNKIRSNSVEESPLNITDSFQYRAEPLIDDHDLVLDTTQDKNLAKKVEELDIVLGLWLGNRKRNSTQLVKSNPKMRRKSDTSNWSGGISALEKRTFFWTFEYVARPVQAMRPSFRKDTENSNKKTDTSPRSSAKKNTQNRLKQWSRMALEMTKEGKDEISFDKDSPYLAVKNQKDTIYLGSNLGTNLALENGPQEYAKIKIWGGSKNSVGSQDDLEIAKSKSCVASPMLKSRSPKHLKLGEQPSFNRTRNTSIMSREPLQFNELQKKKVGEVPEGIKSLKPSRTNSHSSFTMKQSSSLKNSFVGDKTAQHSISKGYRRDLSSELMTTKDDALATSNEENTLRGVSNDKKKPQSKSRSLSKKTDKSKVLLRLKETLINKVYNHSNNNMFFQTTTIKSPSKEERRPQVKSPPPRSYVAISPQMRLPKLNPNQGPVIHESVKGHLERSRVKSVLNQTQGTLKGKMSVPNLLMSPSSKISLLNMSRAEKNNGKLDHSRLNLSEAKVLL